MMGYKDAAHLMFWNGHGDHSPKAEGETERQKAKENVQGERWEFMPSSEELALPWGMARFSCMQLTCSVSQEISIHTRYVCVRAQETTKKIVSSNFKHIPLLTFHLSIPSHCSSNLPCFSCLPIPFLPPIPFYLSSFISSSFSLPSLTFLLSFLPSSTSFLYSYCPFNNHHWLLYAAAYSLI